MNKVIICSDPFEAEDARKEFETEDVFELIQRELKEWPATARLYYGHVAQNCDVTPINDEGVEAVRKLKGTFYVVIYPGDPGIILTNLIIAALLTAAAYFLTPKLSAPTAPADRRIDDASPNNALAARENQARPNGRIPDIFGTVRATPDLLAVPYSIFVNHQEIEHAFLCLGRGEYDVDDVKDGETLISDIDGASVEVYAPNKSPNSGHAPQLSIGTAINRDVTTIQKVIAVNGQTLVPTNSGALIGAGDIKFVRTTGPVGGKIVNSGVIPFQDYFDETNPQQNRVLVVGTNFNNNASRFAPVVDLKFTYPGTITSVGGVVDFRDHFVVGDDVIVPNTPFDDGAGHAGNLAGTYVVSARTASAITLVNPAAVNSDWNVLNATGPHEWTFADIALTAELVSGNLNGTYDITAVTADEITLDTPNAVNADWNLLSRLIPSNETIFLSPTLTPSYDRHIGPFTLPGDQITQVICNFIAPSGLYADNGTKQTRLNLDMEVELREIDASGAPLGGWETFTGNIVGSAVTRTTRALTMTCTPAAGAGRYEVRARQTTDYNYSYTGTIVDEVKWRDCYTSTPIGVTHFGNVTTVQSLTKATDRALSAKSRKLSMLASRKIPRRQGAGFTGALFATSDFELILYAVALDPYIGRRSVSELDLTQIDAIADSVRAYFGDDELATFNYTFDKTGLSFEDTAMAIAAAACCVPYRQGNKMRLAFERETEDSSLLFNHRNKLPKSEKRTFRFGTVKDYDGIEFNYVSPDDDAVVTYYIPADGSALAPKKIDSIGIRSEKQAYVLAQREWNKLQYQTVSTTFEALQQAELLVPNDRVLVADNTRPDTFDGEVISQDGLVLELSQDALLDTTKPGYGAFNAYTIFLQHSDGTVEAIGVRRQGTTDPRLVRLETAPAAPLSLDPNNAARAGYVIVANDDPRPSAFIVTERDQPKDGGFVFPVTAINYDQRYYAEDLNFPA